MTGRVAIYAAPGTGSDDPVAVGLRDRAQSWLGRAVDGTTPEPVAPAGWTRSDVDAITVDARRYGFHGTLKAPFRLGPDTSLAELERDVAAFATSTNAVVIPRLRLGLLGDFFALVPGADDDDLHGLADDVVTRFDRHRAPATPAEIARRNPESLSARRRELLSQWGYPLVLDEFRFHLTVTDRIGPDRHAAVRAVLDDWFADSLGHDVGVEALALFTEAEPGAPFRLHSVHPLRPASRVETPPIDTAVESACAAVIHPGVAR